MKTRLQILEADHDSALAQLVENQINTITLSRRILLVKVGKTYDEMQKIINEKAQKTKDITEVIKIIEELIEKEENAKSQLN
jgi:hypothetical protein